MALSTTTPASDSFAYDVFVSYRQRDPEKAWVRDVLIRHLKAHGLSVCVDYECFRLGAPLVHEMERAVKQSRYTLAILTRAYLESNFTDLESILAEHLGLERSERRLLAAMREPCEPRLGMRVRLWLDMTKDEDVPANLDRLVSELRQPPIT